MSEIDTRIREEYRKLSTIVQARNDKPRKHGALDIMRGDL